MKKVVFYCVVLLITYILTFVVNHPDYDLWARLTVGSIFFQTGWVLPKDIFAYSPTKELWIDHEWGSGIIFFVFAKLFGNWGLFALKALLLLAIFVFILKIIRLNIKKDSNIDLLYFILIAFSIIPGIANLIRAQIFTFLFFVIWIYIMERVRRGENKLLWILPVSMLFWANIHGGFVVGLGLLFIYAIGEFLNKNNCSKYLIALGLALLATLINPYGIKYWPYIIEAVSMPRAAIAEWLPINLSGPFHTIHGFRIHILSGFFVFVLMTLFVGIKLFINKAKADWVKILLFVVALYLSVKHQRHSVLFVLAFASLLYGQYMSIFAGLVSLITNKFSEKISNIIIIVKDSVAYVFILVLCIFLVPKLPTEILVKPIVYPVGAFEFIKQNGLSGNLATTYGWGGMAFWKLYPDCRILIDGRYEEVYPNDTYNIAMDFSERLSENWPKFLDYFHTDIIVAPKMKYTPDDFVNLNNWEIVYEDMISFVLVPRNKVKNRYIYPNFRNRIYWHEDLSKHIKLN